MQANNKYNFFVHCKKILDKIFNPFIFTDK